MSLPVLQWKLDDMNAELRRKVDSHEIHTTNSNVDSLERTVRELRTEIYGLRSELQNIQEEIRMIKAHLVI